MDALDAIERAMVKAVEREQWDRNGKLYVSDAKHALSIDDGGDCKAKLYGKLRDEPQKPINSGTELMFASGDRLHELIVEWLEGNLPEPWGIMGVENRTSVDPLRGRYDIKLVNQQTGEAVIVDVKSKRGNAFGYLHEAKPADVAQVQTYLMAEDADYGVLLYVDREGQNFIRTFRVDRDDAEVQRRIGELVHIRDFAGQFGAPSPDWLIEPVLKRNQNKGKDSLYVSWPWQVEWCNLQECHCLNAVPKALRNPPSGVIGWVTEEASGKLSLEMKEKYAGSDLEDWVWRKLMNGEWQLK